MRSNPAESGRAVATRATRAAKDSGTGGKEIVTAAGQPIGALLLHPGTQHSFRLAEQLARLGLLVEFGTSLALHRGGRLERTLSRLAPPRARAAIGHRTITDVASRLVRQYPDLELNYLLNRFAGRPDEEAYNAKCRLFQARVPNSSISAASHVIGFDGASWLLADAARASGRPFLLDRTAVHPKAHADAVEAIVGRYGRNWLGDVKPAIVRDVELYEIEQADRIVVASSFSRDSLVAAGVAEEKISVNPYGVDAQAFCPVASSRSLSADVRAPLHFLFAGSLTALKGIPVLVDAFCALPPGSAKLSLVGRADDAVLARIPTDRGITHLGKVSRSHLAALMREHDVFVFPTLLDGFGLVLLEAMASGLPTLATSTCAGPDLITDGVEGFVVPPADPAALAERMRLLVDHPELLPAMSAAARRSAERYTWNAYGDRWAGILAQAA